MTQGIDLAAVLAGFTDTWAPRTVGRVNDYEVRVVHALGEFTWHSHPETDEFFLVLSGRLTIRTDDGDVELAPGQMHVVPRGARHQPFAPDGADLLLFEPASTVNTGDNPGGLTAPHRQA